MALRDLIKVISFDNLAKFLTIISAYYFTIERYFQYPI